MEADVRWVGGVAVVLIVLAAVGDTVENVHSDPVAPSAPSPAPALKPASRSRRST
jgi:hypothetical protein